MSEPRSIMRVRLVASDLVPVIQQKGTEQRIGVGGGFTHYAYDQANLLLAAEDLYSMLARVVKDAKKSKASNPLGGSVSDVLLKEATELMQRIYSDS